MARVPTVDQVFGIEVIGRQVVVHEDDADNVVVTWFSRRDPVGNPSVGTYRRRRTVQTAFAGVRSTLPARSTACTSTVCLRGASRFNRSGLVHAR